MCGYVSPEGTYYRCNHYEHETLVKQLVPIVPINEINRKLMSRPFGHKYRKPAGMPLEEYYLMYVKHYIKISSFKDSINQMWLFSYYELTAEQTDFIYPR